MEQLQVQEKPTDALIDFQAALMYPSALRDPQTVWLTRLYTIVKIIISDYYLVA